MSEDVARAVGAKDPEFILIDGVECYPRPLNVLELSEVERGCLQAYRRQFLQAYAENADLLPEGEGVKLIREKLDEAAKFDLTTLPVKFAYEGDKIPISKKLEAWLTDNMEGYASNTLLNGDKKIRAMASAALEGGLLSDETFTELTGTQPSKTKVPYVQWWAGNTFAGRMEMAWQAFAGNKITRTKFNEEMSKRPKELIRVAQMVQHLSTPAVGNG